MTTNRQMQLYRTREPAVKRSSEFGPKATMQAVARQWAFPGFCAQDLIDRCEARAGAGRDQGGACDARGAVRAVPLGNTGTTVVEGAR
jgi:hypothetical protein